MVCGLVRLEEAYACSLVMGQEMLAQESWVEQCMFGSSTTCQFECGSGAFQRRGSAALSPSPPSPVEWPSSCHPVTDPPEEEENPSCLVIKAKPWPAMLAPHCAAVLTVELSPQVMVKMALSLGFLANIPAKVIAEPALLVSRSLV